MTRRLSWIFPSTCLLLHFAAVARGQAPPQNARCLNCHGNQVIIQAGPQERAAMVRLLEGAEPRADATGLLIDDAEYERSVHAVTGCTACHPDCDQLPHAIRTRPATCDRCHAREVLEHVSSVHGRAIAGGDEAAAHCRDCHGTHDMRSAQDPSSSTFKLELPFTCARCHTNAQLMEQTHVHQPQAARQYIESMHGRGLISKGLIIAPSCNDCHGVHRIWPAADPRSWIHRQNIPHTCGTCHVGVQTTYGKSVHGELLAKDDEQAPVCSSCHTAHDIVRPEGLAFKLASDERCGECHADRLRRYRETFHGKAMALGLPGVAACYDCHGQHNIVRVGDPGGPLSPEHRLATCRKCHPQATEKFTSYIAHGDHSDRENYPVLYWTFMFMTTIVVGTFAFFGVHTILWFVRSSVLYLRDPQAVREAKIKAEKDDIVYVRFAPFERFLHVLVILSFLLLVATGMPLKFYYTHWAQVLVGMFGGLEVTTALHRAGAVLTFIYMGLHTFSMLQRAVRYRDSFRDPKTRRYSLRQFLRITFGPDIPVPNLQDVRDWWAHQKWFFRARPAAAV